MQPFSRADALSVVSVSASRLCWNNYYTFTEGTIVSNNSYHDGPGISRSMLMDIHQRRLSGRRTFAARYVTKTAPRETETNAMRIGTVSHVAVLQPDKFDELIAIIPPDVLSKSGSRSGKAWEAFEAEQASLGKTCVKESELQEIRAMRDAVNADALCSWIMSPRAICEHPIYWTDEETGLELRCLPDFVLPLKNKLLCADLKTCADIETFEKALADDYWMQEPHYVAGLRAVYGNDVEIVFGFVAVQKTAPYPVNLFQMSERMSSDSHAKWRAALNVVAECKKSGNWLDQSQLSSVIVDRQIY